MDSLISNVRRNIIAKIEGINSPSDFQTDSHNLNQLHYIAEKNEQVSYTTFLGFIARKRAEEQINLGFCLQSQLVCNMLVTLCTQIGMYVKRLGE